MTQVCGFSQDEQGLLTDPYRMGGFNLQIHHTVLCQAEESAHLCAGKLYLN